MKEKYRYDDYSPPPLEAGRVDGPASDYHDVDVFGREESHQVSPVSIQSPSIHLQ